MKDLKTYFYWDLDNSCCNLTIFYCDLKCGHDGGIDVTTFSLLSLVILVVTSISLLRLSFILYCFNFQHSWLRLMNCCYFRSPSTIKLTAISIHHIQ